MIFLVHPKYFNGPQLKGIILNFKLRPTKSFVLSSLASDPASAPNSTLSRPHLKYLQLTMLNTFLPYWTG